MSKAETVQAIADTLQKFGWSPQINVKWYEPHGFAKGLQKGLVRIAL